MAKRVVGSISLLWGYVANLPYLVQQEEEQEGVELEVKGEQAVALV
jgi:hypothetical protein